MWQDFLSALALVLVIEGIMPFLSPDRFKETLLSVTGMKSSHLRLVGGASMVAGLLFLTLIRH